MAARKTTNTPKATGRARATGTTARTASPKTKSSAAGARAAATGTRRASTKGRRRVSTRKLTFGERAKACAAGVSVNWFVVGALALIPVFGVGLGRLDGYVGEKAPPLYGVKMQIRLVKLPEWVKRSDTIKRDLTKTIDASDLTYQDPDLVGKVEARVKRSPWVRRVVGVKQAADGPVRVECDYRRPVAFVQHKSRYYLVDGEGVRLPGRWKSDCASSARNYFLIWGVAAPPPAAGKTYPGQDLAAALQLAAMLDNQPYRHQLVGIDIANHMGRLDDAVSHVDLITDLRARIRWGRSCGFEVPPEPGVPTKLGSLRKLYRKYRRVDMDEAVVDISRDARGNVYAEPWDRPEPADKRPRKARNKARSGAAGATVAMR